MPEEPLNYYIILELDPTVDDWPTIERQITEMKRKWSQWQTQGKPAGAMYMKALKQMTTDLQDADKRRQHAKAAKQTLAARREEATRLLAELTEGIVRRGRCTPGEVDFVSNKLSASFTRKEVEDHLRRAGVTIHTPVKRTAPDKLDPTVAKEIRTNLDSLRAHQRTGDGTLGTQRRVGSECAELESLYDFLGRGFNKEMPAEQLWAKADEIYKQNNGRSDPEATIRNRLAGQCKQVFKDAAEKRRYDITRELEALETKIRPLVEVEGKRGFISAADVLRLVQRAAALGVKEEDTVAFIEDLAAKATPKPWVVDTATPSSVRDLPQCGFCMSLAAAASDTRCPSCAEPFQQPCPSCGRPTPTRFGCCRHCNFATGAAPRVKALLRAAELDRAHGATAAALQAIDEALTYWPGWKEAVALRERVVREQRDRASELAKIEALARDSKFQACEVELERFKRERGDCGLDGLIARVTSGLAAAQRAHDEGQRLARSGQDPFPRFQEALRQCVDHGATLRAIQAHPPPGPSGLKVVEITNGFRLQWAPAAGSSPGLTYVVLRSTGVAPSASQRGSRLADLTTMSFDDAAAPTGVACYYTVCASRAGVLSHEVTQSGPHMLTAEVQDLRVRPGNGEVILAWTRPPGCSRVETWRAEGGAPRTSDRGIAVRTSGDEAHDAGLTNGRTYGYLVVAVYADPLRRGAELRSRGVTAIASPQAPPAAVEDLAFHREGRVVRLSWTPPTGAGVSVQLRRTAKAPETSVGRVLPVSEAGTLGALVPTTGPGAAQLELAGAVAEHIVPLSVSGGVAVVGRPVFVVNVEEVTELQCEQAGTRVLVTWRWPAGIEEVVVAYACDGYPASAEDPKATRETVTRAHYDRRSGWQLDTTNSRPHYFLVASKGSVGQLSAGRRTFASMGQSLDVRYRVNVSRGLLSRAPREINVDFSGPTTLGKLPGVIVVVGDGRVPVSPDDGATAVDVPQLALTHGAGRVPVPKAYWGARSYAKAFFKDPEAAPELRLLPAGQESLRLG